MEVRALAMSLHVPIRKIVLSADRVSSTGDRLHCRSGMHSFFPVTCSFVVSHDVAVAHTEGYLPQYCFEFFKSMGLSEAICSLLFTQRNRHRLNVFS